MPRRSGFTLFELLMLLVLLLIVGALLLPAVQKVREAANKMMCGNNLRQIAIACHNYHNDHGKLPPGYWGPLEKEEKLGDGSRSQNVGSLTILLPYLEGDMLFRSLRTTASIKPLGAPAGQPGFDFGLDSTSEPWWKQPANQVLAKAKIKLFVCPSQSYSDIPTKGYLISVHNVGLDMESGHSKDEYGRTHYAGVAGCLGKHAPKNTGTLNDDFSKYEGIMANRSNLTLGQLIALDGTSNTLMLGEGLGGQVNRKGRDYAWSWMGVGSMWTYYGVQPASKEVPADTGCYRFGSLHRAGVQFAFADASVRTVLWGKTAVIPKTGNDPTDWSILQQLAGYKDGGLLDVSSIVD